MSTQPQPLTDQILNDPDQFTSAQLSDGTTLKFKGKLNPDQVRLKVSAYRNSQPTQFEKDNGMSQTGKELTSLGLGAASGISGLPETENPVSDAVKGAAQPPGMGEMLLGPGYGVAKGLFNAGKEIFGPSNPNENDEDRAVRRAHGSGTLAGQAAGAAIMPEAAEGRITGGAKDAAGTVLRNEFNELRPVVSGGAQAAGGIAGGLTGHALGLSGGGEFGGAYLGARAGKGLADFLVPDRPNAYPAAERAPTPLKEGPTYNINKQKLTDQIKGQKAAEAQDLADRKPVPLKDSPNAKINADKIATQQSVDQNAPGPNIPASENPNLKLNKQKLADQVKAANTDPENANPITTPGTAYDGFSQKPVRPLIGTPEDWAAHDQKMKILGPEASDAGTYHAARGAVNKKLNLQQRIERRFPK